MSPKDPDHRANKRPSKILHADAANTDDSESFVLEHEMIRWLPLLAANDFLEVHSDRDPAA